MLYPPRIKEIQLLREELHHGEPPSRRETPLSEHHSNSDSGETMLPMKGPSLRRGRAPQVEMFSNEDSNTMLDNWLPAMERAAEWNGWIKGELLTHLAGHLEGRDRQEWSLISESE